MPADETKLRPPSDDEWPVVQGLWDRLADGWARIVARDSPLPLCLTDEEGLFVWVNRAYCELYGYAPDELIGRSFTVVVPPEHREAMSRLHRRFLDGEEEVAMETRVVDSAGRPLDVRVHATRIGDVDGRPLKVTFVHDVTEARQLQRRLEETAARLAAEARTDGLTGLLNHRAVVESLEVEMSRAQRTGRPLAVVMIDLDRFKRINDRWGHPAGDDVLVTIAELLLEATRRPDGVGRYGGEEFLLVLPETALEEAVEVVERLRRRLEESTIPPLEEPVTASAGVTVWRGGDIAALIQRVDRLLYRAKEEGRDRVVAE